MGAVLIGLVAILALATWFLKAKGHTGISKVVAILVVVIVAGYLLFVAMTPPDILVSDNSFKITGPYGITEQIASIEEIDIRDNIPKILSRTNGMDLFGFGLRGNFKLEELGTVKLYLQRNKGPYLFVKYDGKYFIFNNNDSSKTTDIYNKLVTATKK